METNPVSIAMFNSYVKLPVGSFLQPASAVKLYAYEII